MEKDSFVFEKQAQLSQALGHVVRLRIVQALKNYFIAIFSKGSVRVWYNVSDQRVTITTKAVDSNDISVCPIENADEIACLQAFREGCAAIQK